MLTGTPLDLTGLGEVLRAIGVIYWLVAAVAIAFVLVKGKGWVLKLLGVVVVLAVMVLPPALRNVDRMVAQKKVQARLDESTALFKKRCESAGEKLYRTVENVAGVVWMKWRPREMNQQDQYRLDDPYGQDCGGDSCILNLLRVTRDAERNPEGASQHKGVYT